MSKAISSIYYNEETKILTVTFKKGGSHTYSDVPQKVAEAFQQAKSLGSFFNNNIRDNYNNNAEVLL